jgi:hypothetical protein
MKRKPGFKRVGSALAFPFTNGRPLLRLGLIPALVTAGLNYTVLRGIVRLDIDTLAAIGHATWRLQACYILFLAGAALALTLYAVGIHRLIAEDERPGFGMVRFRHRELAYLGVLILAAIAYEVEEALLRLLVTLVSRTTDAAVPAVPGDPVPLQVFGESGPVLIAFLAGALFWLWVNLRLALVFPHAAIAERISLAASWRAMSGNVFRMLVELIVLAIATLPVWLLLCILWMGVAEMVDIDGRPPSARVLLQWASVFAIVIGFLASVGIAYISYAYRDLMEDTAAIPDRPAATTPQPAA